MSTFIFFKNVSSYDRENIKITVLMVKPPHIRYGNVKSTLLFMNSTREVKRSEDKSEINRKSDTILRYRNFTKKNSKYRLLNPSHQTF